MWGKKKPEQESKTSVIEIKHWLNVKFHFKSGRTLEKKVECPQEEFYAFTTKMKETMMVDDNRWFDMIEEKLHPLDTSIIRISEIEYVEFKEEQSSPYDYAF